MEASEEQRFDFEPVDPPDGRAGVIPTATRRRAPLAVEEGPVLSGELESTTALKERISRLRQQATPRSHDGLEREPEERRASPSQSRGRGVEQDPPPESDSLSIAEVYARIKDGIAAQFPGDCWVSGEIRSLRVSNGHRFIELADHGAEGRSAQHLEVACWSPQWRSIEPTLRGAGLTLEVGQVIRVLGRVSVWEGAGRIRFTLSRIDVEALLGAIAAARLALLSRLRDEDLLTRNARITVASVPLRIGLVTSQGSEAQKDFLTQLQRSGYRFEIHFVHTLVQGSEAPAQIAQAIGRLSDFFPDICVVIRGGGSRNDLAAFDSEIVARAIAGAAFPVWVGIGHTGDKSVADEVANACFITPTACGEAVVACVERYWSEVKMRVARISGLARNRLVGAQHHIDHVNSQLERIIASQLSRHDSWRKERYARVISAKTHVLRGERRMFHQRMTNLKRAVARSEDFALAEHVRRSELLRAFDPQRQLARGWSILRQADGTIVRSTVQLEPGQIINAQLHDGSAEVTVERMWTSGGASERVESHRDDEHDRKE